MNARTANHPSTTRRTGRLGRRLAAGAVVAATLFGVAVSPATAGPTDKAIKATIKQTGLEVKGTYARLQWTSNASETVVEVANKVPVQLNGHWQFLGNASTTTVQKTNGAFLHVALLLNPATKYHVILTTVASPNLASAQAVGEFTTLARTLVEVSFESIHVIDDGDDGIKGKGELWWFFDSSFSPGSKGWYRPASSGDTFAVNYLDVKGSYVTGGTVDGKSLTVTIQTHEDDGGYGDFFCPILDTHTGEPYSWSSDCSDTAYAQTEVELPTYVWEGNPVSFTASTPTNMPVRFTVTGTVQATYG